MCDQAGLPAMGDADRMGTSGRVQGTARCGVCLRKQGFAVRLEAPGGRVMSQLGPKASLTGREDGVRQTCSGHGLWLEMGTGRFVARTMSSFGLLRRDCQGLLALYLCPHPVLRRRAPAQLQKGRGSFSLSQGAQHLSVLLFLGTGSCCVIKSTFVTLGIQVLKLSAGQ